MSRNIGFIGSSGGVGVTSIIREISRLLSTKKRVCVIDMNFNMNDLPLTMQKSNFVDLKEFLVKTTNEEHVLFEINSNLSFVSTNAKNFNYELYINEIECFVKNIELKFDFILFDFGRKVKCLSVINEMVLVMNDSVSSIKNSSRIIHELKLLGQTEIFLILNKARVISSIEKRVFGSDEIEKILMVEIKFVLPFYFKNNPFIYSYKNKTFKELVKAILNNKKFENFEMKKYRGIKGFFRRKIYGKFEQGIY
ncbi:MAG: hypothetical protein IJ538_04730 [Clostridia bacterium]|nr:hypothetical protein [Clostridia bacterium]